MQPEESGNTRAVPPTQHHRKILRNLLSSMDIENNPPLKVSTAIDFGVDHNMAPTVLIGVDTQVLGKTVHKTKRRKGRDGRGPPYI